MALAVLVAVGVLLVLFGKPRSGSRDVGAMRGALVVPGFVPDEARLIEVSKSGAETVRVRRAGKDWTVESAWGYPADPERVHSLLQAIEELRVRGVRSSRAASHPDFQVDEAEGLWVRVCGVDDKELAKICVGKSVAYDSCFVRTSGSDNVLEATPNLLQDIGAEGGHTPRPIFFVNKTVLTYKPDDVQRLTLERESGTVVLEKVEAEEPSVNAETGEEETTSVTKWMIRQPEEEEADENACLSIVNGLEHHRARRRRRQDGRRLRRRAAEGQGDDRVQPGVGESARQRALRQLAARAESLLRDDGRRRGAHLRRLQLLLELCRQRPQRAQEGQTRGARGGN